MNDPVIIKTPSCPFCGTHHCVTVDRGDLEKYKKGEGLIQNIFPYLSADEREYINTGICSKCWP